MEVFDIVNKNGLDCLLDKNSSVNGVVEIKSERDIVTARQEAREASRKLGFSLFDQSRMITLVSELARNIFKYAGQGRIYIEFLEGDGGSRGLAFHAIDQGPGIHDVDRALEQGYSTSGSLGAGLPAAKRMADQFSIQTIPGKGTRVTITKWLN